MPAVNAGGSVRSLRRQTSCYGRRCLSMITARWSGTRLVTDLGCPPLGHGKHGLIASLLVPNERRLWAVDRCRSWLGVLAVVVAGGCEGALLYFRPVPHAADHLHANRSYR